MHGIVRMHQAYQLTTTTSYLIAYLYPLIRSLQSIQTSSPHYNGGYQPYPELHKSQPGGHPSPVELLEPVISLILFLVHPASRDLHQNHYQSVRIEFQLGIMENLPYPTIPSAPDPRYLKWRTYPLCTCDQDTLNIINRGYTE
jgi:hypothetical protein